MVLLRKYRTIAKMISVQLPGDSPIIKIEFTGEINKAKEIKPLFNNYIKN